jgi:hypothetical protein
MGYFKSIRDDDSLKKVSDLERVMETKESQLIEIN